VASPARRGVDLLVRGVEAVAGHAVRPPAGCHVRRACARDPANDKAVAATPNDNDLGCTALSMSLHIGGRRGVLERPRLAGGLPALQPDRGSADPGAVLHVRRLLHYETVVRGALDRYRCLRSSRRRSSPPGDGSGGRWWVAQLSREMPVYLCALRNGEGPGPRRDRLRAAAVPIPAPKAARGEHLPRTVVGGCEADRAASPRTPPVREHQESPCPARPSPPTPTSGARPGRRAVLGRPAELVRARHGRTLPGTGRADRRGRGAARGAARRACTGGITARPSADDAKAMTSHWSRPALRRMSARLGQD
jgi:hypothetical protein